jgi:hypothetical protein
MLHVATLVKSSEAMETANASEEIFLPDITQPLPSAQILSNWVGVTI